MGFEELLEQVSKIENDSWEFQHYRQLRRNASQDAIIEAIKEDQKWIRDHAGVVDRRIDRLIDELEREVRKDE